MGGVLLGVASALEPPLPSVVSINNLQRAVGDDILWHNSTRGDQARSHLYDVFREKRDRYDWLCFIDGDQVLPDYALKRLLSHGKKCVSALYFRRENNPYFPIAFQDDPTFQWPMAPLIDYERGKLIKCGATGFGMWLIHREVLEAAHRLMIEETGDETTPLISDGQMREVRQDNRRIGADMRLGYYIRKAGYDIWLDCGLPIGHMALVEIKEDDYWRTHSNWKNRFYYGQIFNMRMKALREEGNVDLETMQAIAKNIELRVQEHVNAMQELRDKIMRLGQENNRLQSEIEVNNAKIREIENSLHAHEGARRDCQRIIQALIGGAVPEAEKEEGASLKKE